MATPDRRCSEPEVPSGSMRVNVMGPRRVRRVSPERSEPHPRELLAYLVCHDAHHLSADQIQSGCGRSAGRRGDAQRKTIHNYLSQLRAGSARAPARRVVAGGYLVEGVDRTGPTFQRLEPRGRRGRRRGRPGPAHRGPRAGPGPALRGRHRRRLRLGRRGAPRRHDDRRPSSLRHAPRRPTSSRPATSSAPRTPPRPACAAHPTTTGSGSSAPGPSRPEARPHRARALAGRRRPPPRRRPTSSASARVARPSRSSSEA